MIFYNNQLMKDEQQLRLFMVRNAASFACFEDHKAALEMQLYQLIENAIKEKENPIVLIEQYLQMSYHGSENIEDVVNFLIDTHYFTHSMYQLEDNWAAYDPTIPNETSILFGGVSKETAVTLFAERTLRSYLETLSMIYND